MPKSLKTVSLDELTQYYHLKRQVMWASKSGVDGPTEEDKGLLWRRRVNSDVNLLFQETSTDHLLEYIKHYTRLNLEESHLN